MFAICWRCLAGANRPLRQEPASQRRRLGCAEEDRSGLFRLERDMCQTAEQHLAALIAAMEPAPPKWLSAASRVPERRQGLGRHASLHAVAEVRLAGAPAEMLCLTSGDVSISSSALDAGRPSPRELPSGHD
jgi:hypothetical protein